MDRVCHVSLRAGMCLPDKLSNVTLSMSPTQKGERPHETRVRHIYSQHATQTQVGTQRAYVRHAQHEARHATVPTQVCVAAVSQTLTTYLPDRLPFGDSECTVYRMCLPDKLSNVTLSMSPTQNGERPHETRVRRTILTTRNTDTSENIFIHFISFHFISFHFISFHFISFHFISFHFISFHFISFHFISFHFISFHFISFHFISFHFISFHFISFHFISFHFISFHFISFHFISFHFISFHSSGNVESFRLCQFFDIIQCTHCLTDRYLCVAIVVFR